VNPATATRAEGSAEVLVRSEGLFPLARKDHLQDARAGLFFRYRTYNPCPACHGQRLQPESLCWKWHGRNLPELYLQQYVTERRASAKTKPQQFKFQNI
jgi:excinuclease UvrABC ATPase subunit